jgi:CheY-like chemotaxis protein
MNPHGKISSKKIAGSPPQPGTLPSHGLHILLADDDSYTRALNAKVLTGSGYKVQTAANGEDARKALELQNFDLLITTENIMPEITGVQLSIRLRSRGVAIPVIMASKRMPTNELKRHPGLRLEAALRKPVIGQKLLQTVKNFLKTAENIASRPRPSLISRKQLSQPKARGGTLQPTRTNFPKRILVVDDEPLIRQLNKEVLSEFGFIVELAENGTAAWDALQLHHYDLIITDNEMPHVTGVELLQKLHAARTVIPVILVSGTMPSEELKQPALLCVEATLHKPYAIADLVKNVNKILGAPKNCRKQLTLKLREPHQSAARGALATIDQIRNINV